MTQNCIKDDNAVILSLMQCTKEGSIARKYTFKGNATMKLTKNEVLKRINGHTDCASEFLQCNIECNIQDKNWMIKETNRSFKTWKVPLRTLDVEFGRGEIYWDMELLNENRVA